MAGPLLGTTLISCSVTATNPSGAESFARECGANSYAAGYNLSTENFIKAVCTLFLRADDQAAVVLPLFEVSEAPTPIDFGQRSCPISLLIWPEFPVDIEEAIPDSLG